MDEVVMTEAESAEERVEVEMGGLGEAYMSNNTIPKPIYPKQFRNNLA